MSGNTAETFGKGLGVAMSTTWANLGATSHWIPGCVCPFDLTVVAHTALNVAARVGHLQTYPIGIPVKTFCDGAFLKEVADFRHECWWKGTTQEGLRQ